MTSKQALSLHQIFICLIFVKNYQYKSILNYNQYLTDIWAVKNETNQIFILLVLEGAVNKLSIGKSKTILL